MQKENSNAISKSIQNAYLIQKVGFDFIDNNLSKQNV
jgi:hypothetical protein